MSENKIITYDIPYDVLNVFKKLGLSGNSIRVTKKHPSLIIYELIDDEPSYKGGDDYTVVTIIEYEGKVYVPTSYMAIKVMK